MRSESVFEEFAAGFPARKFSAGLLIAFIDLYTELGIPDSGIQSFAELVARFPCQTTTGSGKRANTLIVEKNSSLAERIDTFLKLAVGKNMAEPAFITIPDTDK